MRYHTCASRLAISDFQNFDFLISKFWKINNLSFNIHTFFIFIIIKKLSTRIRDIVPLIVHTKFQVDVLITFWIFTIRLLVREIHQAVLWLVNIDPSYDVTDLRNIIIIIKNSKKYIPFFRQKTFFENISRTMARSGTRITTLLFTSKHLPNHMPIYTGGQCWRHRWPQAGSFKVSKSFP